MNDDELWLDERFRRRYPRTAQRLREMAEQEKADSAHRKSIGILRSLYPVANPFEKEVGEFAQKDLSAPYRGERSGEVQKARRSRRSAD